MFAAEASRWGAKFWRESLLENPSGTAASSVGLTRVGRQETKAADANPQGGYSKHHLSTPVFCLWRALRCLSGQSQSALGTTGEHWSVPGWKGRRQVALVLHPVTSGASLSFRCVPFGAAAATL